MKEPIEPAASSKAGAGSAWLRLGISGALLLSEYIALSYTFDAQTVGVRGGVWSILGQAGQIGPLLVVGATAFLLLPSLKDAQFERKAAAKPSAPLLLLHVLLGGGFVYVTSAAFGSAEPPPGPAIAWMLGWAALGAATAVSLVVGVLGEWRWFYQTLLRAVAAGGVLGLVAWLAGTLSTELWRPLSDATFVTVATLLQLAGFELFVDAENVVLGLEGFAVTVAPVCSGFEGIGLFTALIVGFLYRFRETLRFPNALLLLPIGMLAVWFGNSLRIAALMIVGARVDAQMAIGSFHSKAGWVFFCAITLAVAGLGRALPFFTKREATAEDSATTNPTAALLLPVLTWIGVGLLTSLFSDGHDPLYAARVIPTAAVLWVYRAEYREWWQKPTPAAWLVGALVGIAWLLGPLQFSPEEGSRAGPGEGWAALTYGSWLVFRCIGAILIIPICEEIAFRGYLTRVVTNRDFWEVPLARITFAGVLVSSIAFGFVHDRWILGALTGVAYALLLRRSGRMSDAIVAHAMSNAVIAAWVLTTGSWQHW